MRYNKRDIQVAVQKLASSDFYLVRSEILIALPTDRVVALYKSTPNWKDWMPDASFKELERVSDSACVLLVSYRIPLVSNRDVCLYEASQQAPPPPCPPSSTHKHERLGRDQAPPPPGPSAQAHTN